MGVEVQSVRLLALAAQMGVNFASTLTIGRQRMMVNERQIRASLRHLGTHIADEDVAAMAGMLDPFSTKLFEILGARSIDALDFSDYEGATVIHDLNVPLPDEMASRYSAVFDGGTLEHIFNLPTALTNLMQLPEVGGHLIIAAPANNEMGHGFYQFSPELFFQALSPQNGYQIEGLFLAPFFCEDEWLMVKDPGLAKARAGFSGWALPTYVMVVARRTKVCRLFAAAPQQADYVEDWAAEKTSGAPGRSANRMSKLRQAIHRFAPTTVLDSARKLRARRAQPDSRTLIRFDPIQHGPEGVRAFYS